MAKATEQATTTTAKGGSRKLRMPKYSSFRLQKRIKVDHPKLPNAFRIFWESLLVLGRNWKVFLGIIAVYGLLNIVLVRGFNADGGLMEQVRSSMSDMFKGGLSDLVGGASLFVYLVGSAGTTTSEAASVYQMLLVVVVSLVLIWTLRQVYANHKVRVRDGFYFGVYPLVTFSLVMLVVVLQCLPFAISGYIYSTVSSGGMAVSAFEHLLWAFVFFLGTLATLYMLCSSIFALYIVCLPDMTPRRALRAAGNLVRHRRWMTMRKIILMPMILLVAGGLIMVPLIAFAAPVAPWVFFVLSMSALAVMHSYMYKLYRELAE